MNATRRKGGSDDKLTPATQVALAVIAALTLVAILQTVVGAIRCPAEADFELQVNLGNLASKDGSVFHKCTSSKGPKPDRPDSDGKSPQASAPRVSAPGEQKPITLRPGPRPNPAPTVATISCTAVRSSQTSRRQGDPREVDALCRSAVSSVPANYRTQPEIYKLQNDGTVTFNTGRTHNDQELWCNCRPSR